MFENECVIAEGLECASQVETYVDPLLSRLLRLGQMAESDQRLLEVSRCFVVGAARGGLGAGLTKKAYGPVPLLAVEGVVSEPFGMLAQATVVDRLDRVDDAGMQPAALLVQKRSVSHLVGKRVLEGVLDIREQARLVEKFHDLQVREALAQREFGLAVQRLEQRQRNVLADDGSRFEQLLLLTWQPVDACREYRLHCRGHLDGFDGFRQTVGAALANQLFGLHQRSDALLEEERIPLGALDEKLL